MWTRDTANRWCTVRSRVNRDRSPDTASSRLTPTAIRLAGVAAGLALALVGAGCAGRPAVPDDLNLLLVTLDTTRADALGCYGSPAAATPNLDRVASAGARFNRVTACTPMTLPSHCTILTGTWPPAHGVRANGRGALGEQAVTVAELLSESGYRSRAVVGSFVLKRMFGLAQGFELYNDSIPPTTPNGPALERTADQTANAAIANLAELAPARFFLWVHFYDPHYPYRSRAGHPAGSPEAYAEEIAFTDLHVGRVLEALERLGIAGRTAVVVVGDHGEGLGDHRESEHGFLLFETTQRVPLLIRCPGVVPAGSVVETRVRTVDVAPTLLELAGLERRREMQGESVLELAVDAGPHPDRPAYGETWEAHETLAMAPLHSLHQGDWKFVDAPLPRLFDLSLDPAEEHNLADADPARLAAMREALLELAVDIAPDSGGAGPVVDEETADALASLGYASTGDRGPRPERQAGDRVADDPYEQVEVVERYAAAVRALGRDPVAAEGLLREVVLARPEAPSPLFDLTRVLRRARREDEVLEICREVLVKHPDARLPRLHLARLELGKGRLDESIGQLELLLLQEPDDVEVLLELGRARASAGELDRARGHLERARELAPGSTRPLIELARVEARTGNPETALALLEQAQALDPGSAEIQRELGRVRQAPAAP